MNDFPTVIEEALSSPGQCLHECVCILETENKKLRITELKATQAVGTCVLRITELKVTQAACTCVLTREMLFK